MENPRNKWLIGSVSAALVSGAAHSITQEL